MLTNNTRFAPCNALFQSARCRSRQFSTRSQQMVSASSSVTEYSGTEKTYRRQKLKEALAAVILLAAATGDAGAEADFVETPSGLLVEDIKIGTGATPQKGDTVVRQEGFVRGRPCDE
jgi:FKBP-type peptidyl-prolyl cis-trans isomerase